MKKGIERAFTVSLLGLCAALCNSCHHYEFPFDVRNCTSDTLYVSVMPVEAPNQEIFGTDKLAAYPWYFGVLPPDSTEAFGPTEESLEGTVVQIVVISQSTINKYSTEQLASNCYYDCILYFTKEKIKRLHNRIDITSSHLTHHAETDNHR